MIRRSKICSSDSQTALRAETQSITVKRANSRIRLFGWRGIGESYRFQAARVKRIFVRRHCWIAAPLSGDYHRPMRSLLFSFFASAQIASAVEVRGPVVDTTSDPIPNARVTLFTTNLLVFNETRTASDGRFTFPIVANGSYRLGVAARNFQYLEFSLQVT